VEFAATGRPTISGVGDWPPYDATTRPTVVFGMETRVVADPLGGERRAWAPG
jgi:para-nitrobenzyl esterase